ncbi:MAG: TIGR00730 family Rossman fold protein [Candidatus Acidiferrum sp.]
MSHPTPSVTPVNHRIERLCVFCGSSSGNNSAYANAAEQLGRELSAAGVTLVFGGGRVGLMGVLADAVLASGGRAVGVMPKALVEKEIAHTALSQLHIVDSMHERKALMAGLADAFVLLPGGFGSWEEFCEIFTWLQLGIHRKPCGVLNVAGYYDALVLQASRAVSDGFVPASHLESLTIETDPRRLLSRLVSVPAFQSAKWISKPER